jgi:hypothetical protein
MHLGNVNKIGSYVFLLAVEHRECQPCDEQILITRRKLSRPEMEIFLFCPLKGRRIFFSEGNDMEGRGPKKGRAKPSLSGGLLFSRF